ncbi:histidine phosphatase family protein [Pseudomonas sp. K1(2024)]|uniref:Histidine phosphatase family protein n=1 Tax=Pseudomonas boreofloridensis TaxID=3064348 RepID=A0ABV4Z728_9PSED|nr:histidine phosphatase family protein [Pseudomonas sp. K13]MDO7902292.1 histidine phosphatase family protein [Pseudomonas sp. K13]
MQLYVVRHGQTQANLEHRYLGALDPGLTDTGREQAVNLRMELPSAIDSIVVSPSLTSRVFSGFGKTVALGGVYSDADSIVVRSVPFFGKIPGLKWLFNSTSTVKTQTELVLFLTPRLVDADI